MDWAALDYEKIANAIVVLVVGLAAGLGLRSGRRGMISPPPAAAAVEVAGALVDSSSVRNLEGAVKDLVRGLEAAAKILAVSIDEGSAENLNYRKSLERSVEDLTDAMTDMTKGMAALKEEMIRSKRG